MQKHIKNLLNNNSLWLAILVTLIIVFLSLVKITGPQPINVKFLDKIEHTIAYTVLSFLWCVVFRNKTRKDVPVIGCISLGVLLEFLQAQTGYRTFEVNDMLANTLGVFIGMVLSKFYIKK